MLSSPKGKLLESTLPLGAFSISRFTLDEALYQENLVNGTRVELGTKIQSVSFDHNLFHLRASNTDQWQAKVVLGAFGKRSNLDRSLDRSFFKQQSPYMAIKYHRKGEFPDDLVALHNFQNGYCGVSVVDSGLINVCYLSKRKWLKAYGSVELMEEQILYKNPWLKALFAETTSIFDKPLVINAFSFLPKKKVENHILMVGDAAGLISPLCGNGMAMAIHGAAIASSLVSQMMEKKIDRKEMEKQYIAQWNSTFDLRLKMGRLIQRSFQSANFSEGAVLLLQKAPFLLKKIISMTHGKVVEII